MAKTIQNIPTYHLISENGSGILIGEQKTGLWRGISKSLIASKTNDSKIAPVTLHVCNLYIGGPHVAELLDIQFIFSIMW